MGGGRVCDARCVVRCVCAEMEPDESSRIGMYKGVAIRASFTGAGDPHLLNQVRVEQRCALVRCG